MKKREKTELIPLSSASGSAATGCGTPPPDAAGNAEKAARKSFRLLGGISLPEYRSPSLNRILSQHWTANLKNKTLCREMMRSLSSFFAADIPGFRLIWTIWLPHSKPSVTPLRKKSSEPLRMRKRAGCNGSTGSSRGRGRR